MDWAARLIGVFYVVAGLIALRQMAVSWRLELAFGKYFPTQPSERAADVILTVGSALVLISGVTLVLLRSWAVPAFVACWVLQAGYLLWAERWYPPETDGVERLRRHTLHGFAAYSVATAIVMAFDHIEVLS
ncbi:hypothetical protein BH10PSE1_BH10PSE1_05770 [soil metagenome]